MTSKKWFDSAEMTPFRKAVAWTAYGWMRTLALLPFAWQIRIGKAAGRLARRLVPRRNEIVMRNLELCLPELTAGERERLAQAHFEALGASLAEMGMGWFWPREKLAARVRVEGRSHLDAALEAGRGVILYSAHWTASEFIYPVLAEICPRLCGMYKPPRNQLMARLVKERRARYVHRMFDKESVREMISELRRNSVVWYASDQSFTGKGSMLIPFFGEPAMTNTAISRIARITGAKVLPYAGLRLPDDSGYVIRFDAPLGDFPTRDSEADTRRLVAKIEEQIRQCPEQYWWVHQRFKNRPASYADVYAD